MWIEAQLFSPSARRAIFLGFPKNIIFRDEETSRQNGSFLVKRTAKQAHVDEVRDQKVVGSSPVTSTTKKGRLHAFLFFG